MFAPLLQAVTLEVAHGATLGQAFSSDGGGSIALNDVAVMGEGAASTEWASRKDYTAFAHRDGDVFGQRLIAAASTLPPASPTLPGDRHVSQTLEAWVKVLDTGRGRGALLVEGAAGGALLLHDQRAGVSDGEGHVAAGGLCSHASAHAPAIGQWMHVAATFDDVGGTSTDSVYVNGELVATSTCDGSAGARHGTVEPPILPLGTGVRLVWASDTAVYEQLYSDTLDASLAAQSTMFAVADAARLIGPVRRRPMAASTESLTVSFLLTDWSDAADSVWGRRLYEADTASPGANRTLAIGPAGQNPQFRSHAWLDNARVFLAGDGGAFDSLRA